MALVIDEREDLLVAFDFRIQPPGLLLGHPAADDVEHVLIMLGVGGVPPHFKDFFVGVEVIPVLDQLSGVGREKFPDPCLMHLHLLFHGRELAFQLFRHRLRRADKFVRDKETLKVHGGIDRVGAVFLPARCEIDQPHIIPVLAALDLDAGDLVVSEARKAVKIFLRHPPEPEQDGLKLENPADVIIQAGERPDRIQRAPYSLRFLFKFVPDGLKFRQLLRKIIDAPRAAADILRGVFPLIGAVGNPGKDIAVRLDDVVDGFPLVVVRVRGAERGQPCCGSELGDGIFQLNVIPEEIFLHNPVNIVPRTGQADKSHFFDHEPVPPFPYRIFSSAVIIFSNSLSLRKRYAAMQAIE